MFGIVMGLIVLANADESKEPKVLEVDQSEVESNEPEVEADESEADVSEAEVEADESEVDESEVDSEDRTKWKVRPHVDPSFNYHSFSDGENTYRGLNAGGAIGVKYQQRKRGLRSQGLTRVQYVQTIGPNLSGQDIRIGTFIGPWWRIVGLQVGPDLFYNAYNNPGVNIEDVIGISIPATAVIDLRLVNLSASVTPSFYLDGTRPEIDWSVQDYPGVGDEMNYSIGAGVDLWLLGLSASYSRRITSFGEEAIIGVGISVF